MGAVKEEQNFKERDFPNGDSLTKEAVLNPSDSPISRWSKSNDKALRWGLMSLPELCMLCDVLRVIFFLFLYLNSGKSCTPFPLPSPGKTGALGYNTL